MWTPATTEEFATTVRPDQNGAIIQPVRLRAMLYAVRRAGGNASSTQLQELMNAYIYLAKYPYECLEQIASRMISTAALRDV